MKKIFKFLPIILLFGCSGEQVLTTEQMETEIENILSELEGDFAIAYQDLENAERRLSINTDERFHAASTMKTPVLIELYKRAEQGEFSVYDSITVKNEFKSIVDGSPFTMEVTEDSEKDLYNKLGKKTTYYDLAYEMITRSSNLATNILIDHLDAKKVTQTMRGLGADSIMVLRGVEDLKAYRAGLSNSTTAHDLLVMFEKLASGSLVSAKANEEMIAILKDQKYGDMIPALLPEDVEVAHKTGWITNVHHDSGIVFKDGNSGFIMVFLSKNAPDREAVLNAGAEISLLFYQNTK